MEQVSVPAVRVTVPRRPMWLCAADDCGGCYGTFQERCVCGSPLVSIDDLFRPTTPRAAGARIRALLFSLRASDHSPDDECGGWNNYTTDGLRRAALDHAGLCWSTPGEMAPRCGCNWSAEAPEGPREAFAEARLISLRVAARWTDAIKVPCPACGVAPGENCKEVRAYNFHAARHQ